MKVTEEVPDDLQTVRADQIAKIRENSGKVTAVVVVMTVFSKSINVVQCWAQIRRI